MTDYIAGDDVAIANLALSDAECASTIVALDQKHSKAARVCRMHLPLQRDAVLRRYGFGFSVFDELMSSVLPAPAAGRFRTAFAMPADALRIVRVHGLRKRDWRTVGDQRFLAAASGPITVTYVKRVDNLGAWTDPLAIQLLVKKLAIAIAPEMSHSRGIIQRLNLEVERLEADATLLDAFEQDSDEDADDDAYVGSYIAVRAGSTYADAGHRNSTSTTTPDPLDIGNLPPAP